MRWATAGRAAGLCLALVISGAWRAGAEPAEEPEEPPTVWARSGPYLGLSGVHASNDFDHIRSNTDDSLGATARVGYRLNRWVATEIEGEWIAEFEAPADRDIRIGITTVNLKAYPLDTPAQPFLMVGLGALLAKTHGSNITNSRSVGFASRFGGGFDFYFSEQFVVTLAASYVLPTGSVDDFKYTAFQWGFTYRFGGSEEDEEDEDW